MVGRRALRHALGAVESVIKVHPPANQQLLSRRGIAALRLMQRASLAVFGDDQGYADTVPLGLDWLCENKLASHSRRRPLRTGLDPPTPKLFSLGLCAPGAHAEAESGPT
jgi:hypothetical protein